MLKTLTLNIPLGHQGLVSAAMLARACAEIISPPRETAWLTEPNVAVVQWELEDLHRGTAFLLSDVAELASELRLDNIRFLCRGEKAWLGTAHSGVVFADNIVSADSVKPFPAAAKFYLLTGEVFVGDPKACWPEDLPRERVASISYGETRPSLL